MVSPVYEWNTEIEGVMFWRDLAKNDLFYYGMDVTWGELTKQDFAGLRNVYHGEIYLTPTAELLDRARSQLGADLLLPLSPVNYENGVELSDKYDPAHIVELKVIQSLPFEKIIFSASIDLKERDGSNVSDEIERTWALKSIMRGNVKSSYEMVSVQISSTVKVELRRLVDALNSSIPSGGVERIVALEELRKLIKSGTYFEILEDGIQKNPDAKNIVEMYCLEELLGSVFRKDVPLFNFDGGQTILGVELRDRMELDENLVEQLRKVEKEEIEIELSVN